MWPFGRRGRGRGRHARISRSLPNALFPEGHFVEGEVLPPYWDAARQEFPEWPTKGPPRGIKAVRANVIDLIVESARASHPNEFGGQLRVRDGVIEEVILMPGAIGGDKHAILPFHNMPVDFSVKGTVHSHPSPVPYPSEADRELFERYGTIHIIIAQPYTRRTWRAFNQYSEKIDLPVVE